MASNTYAKNYTVATLRAAKVTGVPVADIRANYKNVKDAPKGVKGACILAHRIMDRYTKPAAPAVEGEPAVETAVEVAAE